MAEKKRTCCMCGITNEDEKLDDTFMNVFTIDGVDVCEDCDDRVECSTCNKKIDSDDIEACDACGISICRKCTGDMPVRCVENFCADCVARAKEAFNRALDRSIL